MPFIPPYRERFYKGDLIYGLSSEIIRRYKHTIKFFEDTKKHYDNKGYPPVTIASYLIPSELENMFDFLENMDEKNLEHVKICRDIHKEFQYIENDNYKKYEESFFRHLNLDNKYRSVTESTTYRRKLVGRKCKGGISWISMGDNELTLDIHIHFILDGINMESVVGKYDLNINNDDINTNKNSNQFVSVSLEGERRGNIKSITGKELRWLFRHRANPRVAKKVQFWEGGKPTTPPWVGEKCLIWDKYAVHLEEKEKVDEDRYDGLSRLFHIF
ncbi:MULTISPECIES: hypothetical protein [Xenorhabdus]|uniref:hypothetical protein n=1 Tax=Xenorhabdus TaxID=626 RepID=UPI000648A96B|nr:MULTISPECIES: hypothetical protein [Xenorhabdus]